MAISTTMRIAFLTTKDRREVCWRRTLRVLYNNRGEPWIGCEILSASNCRSGSHHRDMDCGAGVWRDFPSFFPRNGNNHSRAWSLSPFRQLTRAPYHHQASPCSSDGADCLGSAANSSIACFFGTVVRATAHGSRWRYSSYAQRRPISNGFPSASVGHLFDCLLSSFVGRWGQKRKEAASLCPCGIGGVRVFLRFGAVSDRMAADFCLCEKVLLGRRHRDLYQPQSFCGLIGNDVAIHSSLGLAPGRQPEPRSRRQ